jgi:phospholipid transport system substrate-binding protein
LSVNSYSARQEKVILKNSRRFFLGCVLWMVACCGQAWAETEDMASALVRDTTTRMLEVLQQRQDELTQSPGLIYDLVEEMVVPNFDFQRITSYAVGRYWREATAVQRQALVNEFQHMLVRTYAKALLNYAGQEIRFLPLRPGNREGQVTVRTEVNEAGGAPIPIDYSMYMKAGAWKVYDVTIDGVSLVANYRSSFATEIRSKGIDGLIQTMKNRNQSSSA